MTDQRPTRSQLLHEVETLRQRVAELEQAAERPPVPDFGPGTEPPLSPHQSFELLESISAAFYGVDAEWRFIYLNRKAEQVWNRKREELIGKNIWEAFPHGVNTQAYHEFQRVMQDKRPARFETFSAFLDAWVEVEIYPAGSGLSIYFHDITERKRAEDALRASEAQYRLLADHMTDTVWLMDMHLHMVYISPSVTRLRGYTLDELNALPLDQQMTPDSYRRAMLALSDMLAQAQQAPGTAPQPVQLDLEFCRKDGTTFWSDNTVVLIRDEQGQITHLLGGGRDITDRKQAEEARRTSEQRYRTLVDISPLAIFVNRAGRIDFINPAFLTLVGASSPEQVLGKTPFEIFHPDYAALIRERIRQMKEDRSFVPLIEEKIIRFDGTVRDVEVTAALFTDAAGDAIQVILHDITARRQSENALVKSEQTLRLFIEHAPAAIAMFDRDMKYLAVSRRWLEDYRLKDEAIVGRSHYEIFPEIPQRWKDIHRRCLNGAIERCEADPFPREDGTLDWVRWEIHPWHDAQGEIGGILLSSEVITERKRAEEALRISEAFLNSIIQHSPHAMWIADAQGTMILQNQACRDLLHITDEEVVGKYNLLQDTVVAEQGRLPLVKRVFEKGERVQFTLEYESARLENVHLKETVAVILEVTISPVADADGRVINAIVQHVNVTERKRAEEALLKSEQTLRLFIEHAPAAIAMFDRDMRYLAVSRRWLDDYHLHEQNIIGRSHYEIFPEIPERWKQIHQRCLQGAVEKCDADPFPRADGSLDWVRWEIHPWRGSRGEIGGLILFSERITERIEADAALRASETQYRLLADHMADVIWILNPATQRFTYVSPSVERLRGYTPEEVLQQPMDEVITADSRAVIAATLPARIQAFLAGDPAATTRRTNIEQLRRDGSTVWTEVVTTLFKDESGALQILGVSRDISERLQMEDTLRQSEERFSKAFNANPAAMIITRLDDSIITDVNESYERLLGYSRAELVGSRGVDLYDNPAERDIAVQQLRQQGKLHDYEIRLRTKSGDVREVLVSVEIIQLGGETCMLSSLYDITERKRADEALRQSEERFSKAFNANPAAMAITRLSDNILIDANVSCLRILGYSVSEMVGHRALDLNLYVDPAARQFIMQQVAQHGRIHDYEAQLRTKSGDIRDMTFSGEAVTLGGETCLLSIITDITERKRTDEALRQSEERFSKAFNANPAAMIITRLANGQIIDANESYERLLGYSRAELIERRAIDLNIYDDPAEREALVQQLRQHGKVHNRETSLRTKTGALCMGLFSVELVQLGGETCMLSILYDITARKQAEEARRASEERYTRLFENMLNGFAYCKMEFEDGRPQDFIYLAVNKALETLTGLHDVEGKYVSEVIPGIREADPGLFEIYGRVALTGQPEQFETYVEALSMWFAISVYSPAPEYFVAVFDVITERKRAEEEIRSLARFPSENPNPVLRLRPDGLILYANKASTPILKHWNRTANSYAPRYWQSMADDAITRQARTTVEVQYDDQVWSIVISPVPEGHYVNFYGRDITAIRQAEAEILKLNSELEQRVIQRTAELDTANKELEAFAYSVSHDLRAPLRAMDGFSRILMDDYAANLDSSAQRYLRLVRENAQQMGDLIDHLLAFSRLGRQALKIQPVDVADVVCQAVENVYAAREGRDVTIVIGDLPTCQADPVLLRQVYINLLGNALKFTRQRENPTIEVGCLHQDGQDVFFVKDNGVGFDMQYAHKLFGVFQRLHRAEEYEGTGVGLATVQRIIHRHGGRIWAEAEANRGAAFFFTLKGTLS